MVDKNFKQLSPKKYHNVTPAKDKYYFFQEVEKGNYGLMDETGKVIIPAEYEYMWGYSDDLISVQKNKKCGYINIQNKVVIELQFNSANEFKNGFSYVQLSNAASQKPQYAVIDKKGIVISKDIYQEIFSHINGIFEVKKEDGNWYLFNAKTGKYCSEAFKKITRVGDNTYYKAETLSFKSCIIDSTGKIVFGPANDFFNTGDIKNYFTIKQSDKIEMFGNGKIIIEPKYAAAIGNKAPYLIFATDSTTDVYNVQGKLLKSINRKAYSSWYTSNKELLLSYFNNQTLTNLKTNETVYFNSISITEPTTKGFVAVNGNYRSKVYNATKKLIPCWLI